MATTGIYLKCLCTVIVSVEGPTLTSRGKKCLRRGSDFRRNRLVYAVRGCVAGTVSTQQNIGEKMTVFE